MWQRTAGVGGPIGFIVAAVTAGTRQPGYSHLTNHVSGLAAQGEASASLMVPGFLALAASQAVVPAPTRVLERLYRVAAVTTFVAGVVRVGDPSCPQPGSEPPPTASDLGHGAASIATFVVWATMPWIAGGSEAPRWYRRLARGLAVPTIATFALAGVTTRLDSPTKGLAQRAFLSKVLFFQVATGIATRTPTT